jgi:hypothetical protein
MVAGKVISPAMTATMHTDVPELVTGYMKVGSLVCTTNKRVKLSYSV